MNALVKETASDAYVRNHIRCEQLIADLREQITNGPDPESVANWGHAGDLGHVASLLQQAVDFMGCKE